MNVTRRSILGSLLGGILAAAAGRSFAATPPSKPPAPPRIPAFTTPRGVVVACTDRRHGDVGVLSDPGHSHMISTPTCYMVSTGERFVPWDSEEGQAIANEMAVNLRSDGTIRHRQHHWPRN